MGLRPLSAPDPLHKFRNDQPGRAQLLWRRVCALPASEPAVPRAQLQESPRRKPAVCFKHYVERARCAHAEAALLAALADEDAGSLQDIWAVADICGYSLAWRLYELRIRRAALAERPGTAFAPVVRDGLFCRMEPSELCGLLRGGPWLEYLNTPTKCGWLSADVQLREALAASRLDFASLLLEKGLDPRYCYLHSAAACGCKKFLLERLYAAHTGLGISTEISVRTIFHSLIEKGCRPEDGWIAAGRPISLFQALADGAEVHKWMLEALLEAVDAPQVWSPTRPPVPLGAYLHGRPGWARDLLSARARWTPLRAAWVGAVVRAATK